MQRLDCGEIKNNVQNFPNIVKYFRKEWIENECAAGPPYHQLLDWLSEIASPARIEQLVHDFHSEEDDDERRLKMENLMRIFWAQTWVDHVEKCLGFFGREDEQGKGKIIKNLKDDSNFYPFLSQLEIGLQLKNHGYDVVLEDTSVVPGVPIDLLAVKNGRTLIFELATPDMYSTLKQLGIASNVPDRIRSILLTKINEQLHRFYHKTPDPIIILFNLTRPIEADCNGIEYALQGRNVPHLEIGDESGIMGTYTEYERDPEFTGSEYAKILSAAICYDAKNTRFEIKLEGRSITNESAEVKLEERDMSELNTVLFGDYVTVNTGIIDSPFGGREGNVKSDR